MVGDGNITITIFFLISIFYPFFTFSDFLDSLDSIYPFCPYFRYGGNREIYNDINFYPGNDMEKIERK